MAASPARPPDPRQALGRTGEELAAQHLERLGLEIVTRNHRTRHGELDLVAFDPATETLVFVEVKTRRSGGRGGVPFDNLHLRKRAQVRRMAAAYLNQVPERPRGRSLRFDAIGVVIDGRGALVGLEHLEAAF